MDRSWRSRFFIIEHESDFLNIPIVWAKEATFINQSTDYIEDDLDFLGDLLAQCNHIEARANFYMEKFMYRHEHPDEAGLYEVKGGISESESEGIF